MGKKLILAGFLLALPFAVFGPGRAGEEKKKPFVGRNFAHRGLFEADQSVPENSLAAFRRAADAGYGMELDVQLSRDGRVVVFHDDTLLRVCGLDARVDELDWAELRELALCGTGERIPLFSEVLSLVDGRTPLIVELKNGRRNRELCEKTCQMLRAYGGPACIESFHPLIVAWFRLHAPELLRGQLAQQTAEYEKAGMSRWKSTALSHAFFNFLARPEFIAYRIGPKPISVRFAEALGAVRTAWTSRGAENERGNDVVIFEHYRPGIRLHEDAPRE